MTFSLLPRLSGLGLALCLVACGATPQSAKTGVPQSVPAQAPAGQGLYGTLQVMGGARPPPPDCSGLTDPAQRDSCVQAGERGPVWPMRGSFLIRNVDTRDSVPVPLDSLGRYRAELAPGAYQVCIDVADLPPGQRRCSQTLSVKKGGFTPFNMSVPLP